MMKIRYALLLSVSCLGLGSTANAGLTPNITPVGKNTSISTLRGALAGESLLRVSRSSYTHLASQSKLLSVSVFVRRTSSDAAIHNNINGSPRRINSPRDDNSDDLFYYGAGNNVPSLSRAGVEKQSGGLFFADRRRLVSLQRSGSDNSRRYNRVTDASISAARRQDEYDSKNHLLTPALSIKRGRSSVQLVSVCFITDAGNCRGNEYDYGGTNTPDNSSGGTPGGSSSGGDNPEWDLDNKERCNKEGYTLTSCTSVQDPVNYCPYDNTYFER